MTQIKRETVASTGTETDTALFSVAEKARELFGYDLLETTLNKKSSAVAEATGLKAALSDLEIDVLNQVDVFLYQKERLIERATELFKEWMEKTAKDNDFSSRMDAFSGPQWRWQKIEEYKQPIPEFVLAKAVQIKERVPGCVILIESLEDHPDPFLIVGTAEHKYSWMKPEECYYVEVWAEPKFEGKLSNDMPF